MSAEKKNWTHSNSMRTLLIASGIQPATALEQSIGTKLFLLRPPMTEGYLSHVRHYGGFVLAGGIALTIDAAAMVLLTSQTGISPLLARPFSIALAMIASWLINRTVTFRVRAPPTTKEFLKFAAVSWLAQAVNYGVFALILLSRFITDPVAALVVASLVAMFVSYIGFRFGVFDKA